MSSAAVRTARSDIVQAMWLMSTQGKQARYRGAVARLVGVLALFWQLASCSFMFANDTVSPGTKPRCTIGPPVLDTIGIVPAAFLAIMVVGVSGGEHQSPSAVAYTSVIPALVFAGSAVYGYVKYTDCESERE